MKSGLHGRDREAEGVRGVTGRETMHVSHQKNDAVVRLQLVDVPHQHVGQLGRMAEVQVVVPVRDLIILF